MRTLLPALALVLGLFPTGAQAQLPRTFSYQRYVATGAGDPVSGPTMLTFRLYDSLERGSLEWTEIHPDVPVEDGVFNVTLGAITGLGLVDFSKPLYLGIQVGAGPQLAPRTELASAPSALTLVTPAVIRLETQLTNQTSALTLFNESRIPSAPDTYALRAIHGGYDGAAVLGYAQGSGDAHGVEGLSLGSGSGVFGRAEAPNGYAAGVEGECYSPNCTGGRFTGATGVMAVAVWAGGPDIRLGGDDGGRIFSNPSDPESDLWLHSNDAVVVKLDSDKSGEDADFVVRDKDDVVIFDIDESGDLYSDGVLRFSSDANRKERLDPVDQTAILERVRRMSIQEWSYIGDPVRHLGPTAQDFRGAFGLGEDDVSIATVDMDGVALAAIQGLYDLVREQQEEIARLKERLEAMGR